MNQGFVTDSTNLSDDYTRNRIRHKIIPELLKINEGFYKTFSSEIKILKEEKTVLSLSVPRMHTESAETVRV